MARPLNQGAIANPICSVYKEKEFNVTNKDGLVPGIVMRNQETRIAVPPVI
jgi:hypothetical protein